ncbi:ECF-type sigma factor [Fuerstiella marisgermanici]|uniref:RNA polymerase sigma factor n=1 Tax=Fuerstiella marisgermanici TaxID=1891926 RepID=A0A1P8WEP7_9PLAN|nr:ECF-type sigma factor [Fuerstiella marisgermanici]APZ92497.1 RNA polymerase sigma factor [Fuerstiella marisgermanici]
MGPHVTKTGFNIPPQDDPDDEGSITRIIRRMQSGDEDGADFLWKRFYARLKFLVKNRLRSQMRGVSDEEDVALESISELFRGLLDGKYPSLHNREAFWRLLVTVATRNVIDEINRENRLKRGAGKVYHESAFDSSEGSRTALFERIASSTQAPDMQLMITERCTELLESLTDTNLQAIAVMKTAGSTNHEIAESLGLSLRSVERRLADIRQCWAGEVK